MKKLTKGLIIAAVLMILIGIGLFIGGIMAAGGVAATRTALSGYEFVIDEDGLDVDFEIGNQPSVNPEITIGSEVQYADMEQTTFPMEDVKSLNLEIEEAEVEFGGITTDQKFSVRTDGNYEMYIKNSVLHIKSKGNRDAHKMLIEIPGEFVFENVEISVGASVLDIHNLETRVFELEVGAGRAEIGQLVADKAEFEVGAGEIIVTYGNVYECEANVDMGNLEYTGMILRHGDVECNMGNAEFTLERDVEDYNFEIECGAGNVDIGDESFSGLGSEKYINHQVQEQFDIECNMGNVSINAE